MNTENTNSFTPKLKDGTELDADSIRVIEDRGNGILKGVTKDRCWKCGGSGFYAPFGTCFSCNGLGFVYSKARLIYTTPAAYSKVARAEQKKADRKAAKLQREFDERAAKIEAFMDRNEQLYADIAKLQRPSAFILDVANKGRMSGELTDRQLDSLAAAVLKQLDREAEDANAADCPTGRVEITGTILSVKFKDSCYGGGYKMLVKAESGFKVWGSVPTAVYDAAGHPDDLRGATVTFTATVTRSNDDSSFGFFKRPSNADVSDLPAIAC